METSKRQLLEILSAGSAAWSYNAVTYCIEGTLLVCVSVVQNSGE